MHYFPSETTLGCLLTPAPGPINFRDVHPRVLTEWGHGVTVSTDWIF
jgi:hypothetical protein